MTKKDKTPSVFGQSRHKLASKLSMGGSNYSLDSPKNEKENPKSTAQYLPFLLAFAFLVLPRETSSHRSGCHRWHSCPSDRETYVCGDQGYFTQCLDNQVISNTGFESPCSTKGESCRFSPLETPSALCPPQEAGFTLNHYCLNRNPSSGLVPGMHIDLLHYSLRRHGLI